MSTVILARDSRGLGKKGEPYECPNDEVADKLIRLGYAVVAEADLPSVTDGASAETVPQASDDPAPAASEADVTSFDDLQTNEDEALLASGDDPAFADAATADAEEPKRKKATRKKSEKKA